MTTSASYNYELTAAQMISESFKLLGVRTAETPLEDFEIQDGLTALNLMLKTWEMQGMHLWTREEAILFLDKGKAKYFVGSLGDESCNLADFVGTTTTAAHVATDTVIAVTDSTGMTAADEVGILQDDGTRHWTTIVSVDSSIQITITTGLVSGAASGATVFTYTSKIQRPTRVSSIRRVTYGTDSEIKVDMIAREQYFDQVNKETQGTVVQAYYTSFRASGLLYIWNTSDSANKYLRLSYERPIQDVDLVSETLDIPQEWQETVIYNLAARLTNSYTVPPQKRQDIISAAAHFLEQALGYDEEIASIFIQPDFT